MKQSFGIQATAAAFDTLSSRLYSNPILAVIRELSTNANDAHIEAGVEKPFDLHIPTSNEPFFDVRDYGNGIPEELIYNIYTTFFMSTKTEDENQTGYFGLGSKSPYSLVDEYFVTSYCEGRKKVYKMSKSGGCPTVEKISDDPLTSETGLEIKFAYDSSFGRFEDEAVNFFMGTSFLPNWNIKNINYEEYAKERLFYTNESIETGTNGTAIFINVAGVKFPVASYEIKGYNESINSIMSKACISRINIMANKNDVTLTPSRETLHYDDKTIKFIHDAVISRIDNYYKEINEKYANGEFSFYDILNMINRQSYDKALSEKCADMINDNFFQYEAQCVRGSRGVSIDLATATRDFSRSGWRSFKEVYLIDFSGTRTDVKQKVIDNFYSGDTIDTDKMKITSTSFTNMLKQASNTNSNFVVFFPKTLAKLESCKKILGDVAKTVKWSSLTVEKKDSTEKRRVGFKTHATTLFNSPNDYKSYWGNNPDLEENEVGVIIEEENTNYMNFINAIYCFEPNTKLALRPCKESVYKKMKEKGYDSISEYCTKVLSNHKDVLKNELTKLQIFDIITNIATNRFEQELADKLANPKYDILENVESFANLRKLYTKENYSNKPNYRLRFIKPEVWGVSPINMSFADFPMINEFNLSFTEKNVDILCDYMLEHYNSEDFGKTKEEKEVN